MNEIVERKPKPALVAGGAVSAIIPTSIEECFRLSEAIHSAGMSPYGLDTPQKVMIAMMSGLELGMPPMMAVQSIAVINNRPCMWGDALIGVVRNSGACTYIKEWIEGTGDDRVAFCETQRKGELDPVVRQFSVDDAKRANLWQTEARVTKTGKGGGTYEKDNDSPWYRYPQRMLQMRARAWCLRDVYPDVLKGMQVREEVEDYQHVGPDNAKDITPARPAGNAGGSVIERLKQSQSNNGSGGFDHDRVKNDLNTAAPPRGGDDEQPLSSSQTVDEPNPNSSTVDLSPADPAIGSREAEGAGSESGDDPAPSDLEKDRTWLFNVGVMLWGATNYNGDEDVLKNQRAAAAEAYPATGVSEPFLKKATSVFKNCMSVVQGSLDPDDGLKMVAGIIGCEEKVLQAKAKGGKA